MPQRWQTVHRWASPTSPGSLGTPHPTRCARVCAPGAFFVNCCKLIHHDLHFRLFLIIKFESRKIRLVGFQILKVVATFGSNSLNMFEQPNFLGSLGRRFDLLFWPVQLIANKHLWVSLGRGGKWQYLPCASGGHVGVVKSLVGALGGKMKCAPHLG